MEQCNHLGVSPISKAMVHLNSHILCCVDVCTTGPNPAENEIWHICILPLDSNIKPSKTIIPFYTCLKPERPELVENKFINREQLTDACLRGMKQDVAADLILEWFDQKLKLPPEKKIQPLAYDWPYVSSFLTAWMGFNQMNLMFHRWYRDILPYSLHANDSADLNIEQVPYPKSTQSFLESRLKVPNSVRREPMSDCIAIAEMWQKSLKRLF